MHDDTDAARSVKDANRIPPLYGVALWLLQLAVFPSPLYWDSIPVLRNISPAWGCFASTAVAAFCLYLLFRCAVGDQRSQDFVSPYKGILVYTVMAVGSFAVGIALCLRH